MECFLMSVFCFFPTAGQPAVEKYELLSFMFIVHKASNSQLFGKILSRDMFWILQHYKFAG